MRTTLANPDHEALLDRYGYAVIPAVDDEWTERLRNVHARLGVAPDDPRVALHFGFHSQDEGYKRQVADALIPLTEELVGRLFDDHSVYLAMFITKWSGPNSGFGPHQDPTLVDERKYRGVKIWIPLGPTGVEDGRDNGMLHVVPGSHRFLDEPRTRDVDDFSFAAHEELIINRHGVGIPTRAGEAIVFDDRLIHYSMPNETTEPRVVVALGMRPTEAACVMLRSRGDDIEMYEIDQERYLDLVPAALYRWQPDEPPLELLQRRASVVTADQFVSWCEGVGPAPSSVEGRRPDATVDGADIDPGLFCAFCGTTEELEVGHRDGLRKAQLLCASCRAGIDPDAVVSAGDAPGSVRATIDRSGLRVLLVGGTPDGSPADVALRAVAGELATCSTLSVAMLLDGDQRESWAAVDGSLIVLDDVRTWRPASVADRWLPPGIGAHLRGLLLRARARRLGDFDAVVLHDGVGGRVVELLRARPAVVCTLGVSDGPAVATDADTSWRDPDLVFAAGSRTTGADIVEALAKRVSRR